MQGREMREKMREEMRVFWMQVAVECKNHSVWDNVLKIKLKEVKFFKNVSLDLAFFSFHCLAFHNFFHSRFKNMFFWKLNLTWAPSVFLESRLMTKTLQKTCGMQKHALCELPLYSHHYRNKQVNDLNTLQSTDSHSVSYKQTQNWFLIKSDVSMLLSLIRAKSML